MKGEQGFTLVEMLVALVAGGLLLASLGSLTGMLGSEVRRTARGDQFDQLAKIAPSLTLLLQSVRPTGGTKTLDADASHLTGEIDPPLARAGQGPMRLGLTVMRDRDGEALDLDLGNPADDASATDNRRLVHGFRKIDIDIRQSDPGTGVPSLITLGFTTQSGEDWDIVVEPRLNAIGGCRFDPISMSCRP